MVSGGRPGLVFEAAGGGVRTAILLGDGFTSSTPRVSAIQESSSRRYLRTVPAVCPPTRVPLDLAVNTLRRQRRLVEAGLGGLAERGAALHLLANPPPFVRSDIFQAGKLVFVLPLTVSSGDS